jgi:hypothetical protein
MASVALSKMRHQIERFKASTARAREKAGEVTHTILEIAETGGTCFAFGYYEGMITDPKKFELFSVPVPLLTGVAAHAFALLGVGRGMEDHLKAIGTGALAAHLNGIGRVMGAKHAAKSPDGRKQPSAIYGDDDTALPGRRQGVGVTEDALRAYAR